MCLLLEKDFKTKMLIEKNYQPDRRYEEMNPIKHYLEKKVAVKATRAQSVAPEARILISY